MPGLNDSQETVDVDSLMVVMPLRALDPGPLGNLMSSVNSNTTALDGLEFVSTHGQTGDDSALVLHREKQFSLQHELRIPRAQRPRKLRNGAKSRFLPIFVELGVVEPDPNAGLGKNRAQ